MKLTTSFFLTGKVNSYFFSQPILSLLGMWTDSWFFLICDVPVCCRLVPHLSCKFVSNWKVLSSFVRWTADSYLVCEVYRIPIADNFLNCEIDSWFVCHVNSSILLHLWDEQLIFSIVMKETADFFDSYERDGWFFFSAVKWTTVHSWSVLLAAVLFSTCWCDAFTLVNSSRDSWFLLSTVGTYVDMWIGRPINTTHGSNATS